MSTEQVQRRALQSQSLSDWISSSAQDSQYPDVARLVIAVASFDLSLQHHISISQLVVLERHASAMSLGRPQFESFIRGVWFLYCATEAQIAKFQRGIFDVKLTAMLQALQKHPVVKGGALMAYMNGEGAKLHGYTHGGHALLNKLLFTDGSICESDVLDLLVFTDGIALKVAMVMAGGFSNDAMQKGVAERTTLVRSEASARGL